MIIFERFTDNKDGLFYTSTFDNKILRLKIIEPYSGLIFWSQQQQVGKTSYYFSFPRRLNYFGFEISDFYTDEIYLKLNIIDSNFSSIETADVLGRLKNFKYSEIKQDLWSAFTMYDIFVDNCYDADFCKVEKDDLVIDIGANIGLFSYYSVLKGASRVYAFEPGLSQAYAIRDNFGTLPIVVEQKAVSSKNGILKLRKHKTNSVLSDIFSDEVSDDYEIVECPTINLESYCELNNIKKVNFLKVDCEGSEYEIFESLSKNFITNCIDKIQMEFHINKNGKIYEIVNKLQECDFEVKSSDLTGEIGFLHAFKNK
jgi:FkbM family methyltransferase